MPRTDDGAWDVLVVGRGPAGLAAAITSRRAGLSVAVAGLADAVPRWGETLSASCHPLLCRLGIGDELRSEHHLSLRGVRSAWGMGAAQERSSIFHPYGESAILDRARFDRRLESVFQSDGGIVMEGRMQSVRFDGALHVLTLRDGQCGKQLKAKGIIDATGIAAHVARRLGARRITQTRQVAIGCCFEAPPGITDHPTTAIVEGVELGWLFAVPVPMGGVAVWLVCDPAQAAQDGAMKRALRASQEVSRWLRSLQLQLRSKLVLRNASVGKLDRVTGAGWIAVGDAALSLDPMSSSGVTLAMLSGLHGGAAIAAWLSGDSDQLAGYAQTLQNAAEHHVELRQRLYRAERRWPRADFWMPRQNLGFTAEDDYDSLGRY
ncbi:NAD(P)/FAD-dependent oxidoreductase [Paraburkholderia sp. UYCP14C]|uniref:NAD(P)/FAD-dependent oxidoreductase n=1 Tax=Paraburkholderia sp. UYCP14C TaxID=2511130 RepID=UPI00101F6E2F|nr:NAD(P)/FAD-dependent oxidoreductase [Paraburkholderia sp. UYCP14C]RZF30008.1 NAD(P)/FAD-dependent oxidoreductase [Paraburkholderia sp. UYCP14C]